MGKIKISCPFLYTLNIFYYIKLGYIYLIVNLIKIYILKFYECNQTRRNSARV